MDGFDLRRLINRKAVLERVVLWTVWYAPSLGNGYIKRQVFFTNIIYPIIIQKLSLNESY